MVRGDSGSASGRKQSSGRKDFEDYRRKKADVEVKQEYDGRDNGGLSLKKYLTGIVVILLIVGSIGFLLYDLDGDGISNLEELRTEGYSPFDDDSNDNGIDDGTEQKIGFDHTRDYPEDFVKAVGSLAGYNDTAAREFIDTVYEDGEMDDQESKMVDDIVSIDNSKISGKLFLNSVEDPSSNLDLVSEVLEKVPNGDKSLYKQYLGGWPGDRLNKTEKDELKFLEKDKYGITSDLFGGPEGLNDNEREYVRLLESDQKILKGLNRTFRLFDDGDMSDNDLEFASYFFGNDTKNIHPQRLHLGYSEDGKITDEELKGLRDPDDDAAITAVERLFSENHVGKLDPRNPDTDGDGVPDGPEIFGGYQLKSISWSFEDEPYHGKNEPANLSGRSPVHKEANIVFINRVGEENFTLDMVDEQLESLKEIFDEAPIENPDGTQGIDLIYDYTRGENFPDDCSDHPKFMVAYFGNLASQNLGSVGGNLFRVWATHPNPDAFRQAVAHEFGHNIFGTLNNESIWGNERGTHSNSETAFMYPQWTNKQDHYLPQVWNDISEDGMLGLLCSPDDPKNKDRSDYGFAVSYRFGGEEILDEITDGS